MQNIQKIKNIEFLRVIGCISVILLHLFPNVMLHGLFPDIELYDKLFKMTSNGQKAVDLFFILSGLFFTLKLDLTKSLWNFLKKKLIRLYPVLIFITILCFIASLFGTMEFQFYDNLLSLLCLNGTSLVLYKGNTHSFWYVSTMLWVFVLYYYLLKNYEKKHVNLFIAAAIFFCYSFIIHAKSGKIDNNIQTFYCIFNVGMMRGLGGIGIGYFIGEWYKNNLDKIKNLAFSFKSKFVLTCLEFICLYFIINNLMLHKLQYKNNLIYIVSFVVIIILFLLKQGFISKILENKIWENLSKYTYSLYMTHFVLFYILKDSVWKHYPEWVYAHPIENVIYTLLGVLVLGIFTYHFVEKPCAIYLKNKIKD